MEAFLASTAGTGACPYDFTPILHTYGRAPPPPKPGRYQVQGPKSALEDFGLWTLDFGLLAKARYQAARRLVGRPRGPGCPGARGHRPWSWGAASGRTEARWRSHRAGASRPIR